MWLNDPSSLERLVNVPRATTLRTSPISLSFRGHLITNFPQVMVLLMIINWQQVMLEKSLQLQEKFLLSLPI